MTEYIKKKKKPTGLPSLGKVGRTLKKDRIEGVTEPFKGYQLKDSDVVIMAPKKEILKKLDTDRYSKGGRADRRHRS